MTKLEEEIEEYYHGWMRKYHWNLNILPTHFIISDKTYAQLRREYSFNDLVTKSTIRGLPFIVDHEKDDHYIAVAFISEEKYKRK